MAGKQIKGNLGGHHEKFDNPMDYLYKCASKMNFLIDIFDSADLSCFEGRGIVWIAQDIRDEIEEAINMLNSNEYGDSEKEKLEEAA